MSAAGGHAVPRSQRGDTNVAGVWIAGDLRPITQQVAVAMGTGSLAAVMIDQHLRRDEAKRGNERRGGGAPPALWERGRPPPRVRGGVEPRFAAVGIWLCYVFC